MMESTGFLVPPGDEAAPAEKIRWVFEQPERTREMGRDARAFAERFFSTTAIYKWLQTDF